MCGRYAASANPDELALEFEIDVDRTDEPARSVLVHPQSPPAGSPDWNMAPSKQAPVVLTRPPRPADRGSEAVGGEDRDEPAEPDGTDAVEPPPLRQLRLLTWGLVPSWAKDVKVGVRTINARAESALTKPSFKRAALARRCLVPASGWYEWQVSPSATDAKGRPRKQPFFVRRADGEDLAMAGLYEFWRDPDIEDGNDPDAWLTTFAIVTTKAEPGLDRIHDRQPLVLERDDWAEWLDPGMTDPDAVADLLAFSRAGRFEAYPISTSVNSVRSNGPQLLDPAPREDLAGVVDPATGEVLA
jgi:putative SOS response-associated peptidase YedK